MLSPVPYFKKLEPMHVYTWGEFTKLYLAGMIGGQESDV